MLTIENVTISYLGSFYKNQDITGYDLTVYTYMCLYTFNHLYNEYYFVPRNIAFLMYQDLPNKEKSRSVRESLKKIFSLSFIAGEELDDGGFYIDRTCLYGFHEPFVPLKFLDIEKIISSNYKYKYELVKLFLLILGSRRFNGEKRTYSEMALSYFASYMDKDKKTISRYISALENMDLIYVFRDKEFGEKNIYAAYEDRDYVRDLPILSDRIDNASSNTGRSLMQKYYWVQRGKTYPQEEMIQIRNYIEKKNKTHAALQKEYPDGDYPQYDISILS